MSSTLFYRAGFWVILQRYLHLLTIYAFWWSWILCYITALSTPTHNLRFLMELDFELYYSVIYTYSQSTLFDGAGFWVILQRYLHLLTVYAFWWSWILSYITALSTPTHSLRFLMELDFESYNSVIYIYSQSTFFDGTEFWVILQRYL